MGKYERKAVPPPKGRRQKRNKKIILIIVLAVITLLAFVLYVMPQMLYDMRGQTQTEPAMQVLPTAAEPTVTLPPETEPVPTAATETDMQTQAPQSEAEQLSFPVSCADGKLEILSLFQYSGMNPDDGNLEGINLAAVMVQNISEEYLEEAAFSLALDNGATLRFRVTELPAETTAMAFSLGSSSIDEDAACLELTCDARFAASENIGADRIEVSVDGTAVTLTNMTDTDFSELIVCCRSPFGDAYFGGLAYQYLVRELPAGGSATIDAVDCILGVTEVVRITTGKR